MGDNMKEVIFSDYCCKCKHYDKNGTEEPCDECLSIPMRYDSHKPEKFEKDEIKNGKKNNRYGSNSNLV